MNLLIRADFKEFTEANPEYPVFNPKKWLEGYKEDQLSFRCFVAKAMSLVAEQLDPLYNRVLFTVLAQSRKYGCDFIVIDEGRGVNKRIEIECFPIVRMRP